MPLRYRKHFALAAAAAALVFSTAMAHAIAIVTPDITYTWTGTCTDCNPPDFSSTPASATFKTHNYTPGTAFTSVSQIVALSFHYNSMLFDIGASAPYYVSGNIPAGGGAAAFVFKWLGGSQANDVYEFRTYTNGAWLFFEDFAPADMGRNSNFQAQVPEPASLALLGLGLAGLRVSRRRQT